MNLFLLSRTFTGSRGSFPRIKRPESEADNSLPSNAEAWNTRIFSPTPHTRLHDEVLSAWGTLPSPFTTSDWLWGPPSILDSFPGGKAAGHEADHSPPCSAEVKNAWRYTSTPQYVFMSWCLVKHRDNFTFTWTSYLHVMLPKTIKMATDINNDRFPSICSPSRMSNNEVSNFR
jgi:hypothetical protein